MSRLDPYPRPAFEWFFATMRDVTATTTRYVREDTGAIGGPIRYQRLRTLDLTSSVNDGGEGAAAHDHDRSDVLPAAGTRCAVLVVAGDLDGAMAFPEILS